MKNLSVIGFFALCLIGSGLISCSQQSTAAKSIYGQIEADEIDVASRIAARVIKIHVQPGQKVKAGDALVSFEDDVIAAKRKQAEALVAAAESKKNIAENAVRPEEKDQLKAAVSAAKKQLDFAKTSLDRSRSAFNEGAISQQNLDEVEFKYEASLENYNAAAAKQRMATVGARAEEKAGAQALVDQAKNGLAEVDSYGKDMTLTAPVDGEVFQILNHEGELVPAGYPVVTLVKVDKPWVSFHVPETKLKEFEMGKKVDIQIPGLDKQKATTEVTYIAPAAGFANQTSSQDRGTFDLKTFELRLSFTEPVPALRPGMTALIPDKK